MSSKIGLLLSLVIFTMFFLLSVDVMAIQYHYSDLDSQSVTIGFEIAHLETLNDENIEVLEEKHHVIITNISNKTPDYGEVIYYTILREYKPIIVSKEVMELKIERSSVRGYY